MDDFKIGDRVAVIMDTSYCGGFAGYAGRIVAEHAHKVWVRLDGIDYSIASEGAPGVAAFYPHELTREYGEQTGIARSAGAALAHGDRMDEYGDPAVSFTRIADLWTTYLDGIGGDELLPEDVAKMMILLKISRSITDDKSDTLDDIDGYVECLRLIKGDA